MSAGVFTNTFCQMNALPSQIWYGTVQPETETAVFGTIPNTPVVGPATQLVPFKVSKSYGEMGYRPPMVHGYFTASPPAGYKPFSPIKIPALTPAAVTGALSALNTATGNSYQGISFFITGVSLEDLN